VFNRDDPKWEQDEERFIQRYFGPAVPVGLLLTFALLNLDLPMGVRFAGVATLAVMGVYLMVLLGIAFRRRRYRRTGDTHGIR
jgi:Na+-driven multidrug efflux pump